MKKINEEKMTQERGDFFSQSNGEEVRTGTEIIKVISERCRVPVAAHSDCSCVCSIRRK